MSPTRRLHGVAAFSAAALATASLAGAGVAADECTDDDCLADNIAIPGLDELLAGGPSLEFIREMMEAQGLPQETIDQTMALYEQMGLLESGGGIADAFMKGEGAPEPAIGETEKNDGAGPGSGLREMIAAFGGEEIPEETMALIEQMFADGSFMQPGQDLSELFAKAAPGDDQTGETAEGWPAKWYSELPELIAAFGGAGILTENVTLNYLRQAVESGAIPAGALAEIEDALVQAQVLKPGDDLGTLLAKAAPTEDETGEAFLKVETQDPGEGAFYKVTYAVDEALTVAEAALAQAAANGDIDQATLDAILALLPDE